MKRLRALLLAAVTTGGLVCFGQEPDWWKSQRDLTTLLLASNTPIAKLVAAVTARPAVDGPAAMFKLCVFTRAGMNEQVLAALRELKAACPTLNGYQVNSIYYDACDHETAWDVAQAVVEVFAENVNDLTLENRLLKHWLESFLDTGNWRDAEAIFPEASRRLTAQEIPQWHSRLALAAAKDGAKADALRLWFRTANVSPTTTGGLAELARLGLRDDLAALYRAMQKEMPASHAPARALTLLEAK